VEKIAPDVFSSLTAFNFMLCEILQTKKTSNKNIGDSDLFRFVDIFENKCLKNNNRIRKIEQKVFPVTSNVINGVYWQSARYNFKTVFFF